MDKCYFCNGKLNYISNIWSTCTKHTITTKTDEVYHFSDGSVDYFVCHEDIDYRFIISDDSLIIRKGRFEFAKFQLNKLENFTVEKSLPLLKKVLNNKAFI